MSLIVWFSRFSNISIHPTFYLSHWNTLHVNKKSDILLFRSNPIILSSFSNTKMELVDKERGEGIKLFEIKKWSLLFDVMNSDQVHRR